MNEREKEVFKNFGINIRIFREERNMTIEHLSQITGIRVDYLKKIESGTAFRLSTKHIFIFAKAFKLEPYEIVRNI